MAQAKDRGKPRGAKARERAGGFTAEERAAMKERAREARAAARGKAADGEAEVLAKIAAMPEADRSLAQRLHGLIKDAAPELEPRTWYGMPAYARGGKVVCYFQGASKFRSRYATLGFSDQASLDDGAMWPVAFALTRMGASEEAAIRALLRRALG